MELISLSHLRQQVDFRSDPKSGYTADVKYEIQTENKISKNGLGSGYGGSIGQLPLAFDDSVHTGYGANAIIPLA